MPGGVVILRLSVGQVIVLSSTSLISRVGVTAAGRVAGESSRASVAVMLPVLFLLVFLELVLEEVCANGTSSGTG